MPFSRIRPITFTLSAGSSSSVAAPSSVYASPVFAASGTTPMNSTHNNEWKIVSAMPVPATWRNEPSSSGASAVNAAPSMPPIDVPS